MVEAFFLESVEVEGPIHTLMNLYEEIRSTFI